jgi:nitroreductase
METWDAITSRRNVREYDEHREIPEEHLHRILEAGWRAPSARNWQPWDFILVTGRERLQELSQVWQGGRHIAQASAAIVIVIPVQEEERLRELVRYDIGQAAMQMVIAATDLGIGSGHSSIGDQDLARRLLGFPDDRTGGIILDFGYPADGPLKPGVKLKRRPFDEVVHSGTW